MNDILPPIPVMRIDNSNSYVIDNTILDIQTNGYPYTVGGNSRLLAHRLLQTPIRCFQPRPSLDISPLFSTENVKILNDYKHYEELINSHFKYRKVKPIPLENFRNMEEIVRFITSQ